MKLLSWALGVINVLAFVSVLLLTSVELPAFNMGFYEKEYEKNGTYAQIGITPEGLAEVTQHMLAYMKGGHDSLNMETEINGQPRLFFSEKEISHMKDVKGLIQGGYTVRLVLLALFIFSLFPLVFIKKLFLSILFRCYTIVSASILAILLVLGLFTVFNFEGAFTVFHLIFFNNDLWRLDPSVDLLVNIVPLGFFRDIALQIGIYFISGLVILLAAGAVLSRRFRLPTPVITK